jgi:hypothetical protein
VRAYSASDEEALRARDLAKDWTGEGFLTAEQRQLIESDTVCGLRRTNIFLRVVLFLFTLLVVGAVVGLFFLLFLDRATQQTTGLFLLIFAALSCGAAEVAISQYRLYRYGIEEALACCSVGLLCVGMDAALFSGPYAPAADRMEFLVPAAGATASLWIWYRFGLPYAQLATMLFIAWLAHEWTSSHPAQHLIVAGLYAAGLVIVVAARRPHRHTYLNDQYSIAEGLLWLGIYLAINLLLSALELFPQWWNIPPVTNEFPKPFYWTTWVLTWCLPPAVLTRGIRGKDPFIIAMGMITAILTLVTNKPYLGWPRHTWDPMLLGALFVGVALFLRRWLAQGPGEIRRGFTARRLSGKEKAWMNAGTTVIGLASPHIVAPHPQTGVHFEGGRSGGGGASSDF